VILVDSSVWIDYFNGEEGIHTEYLDKQIGVEPIAIGDLMLTEVLQGFRKDRDFRRARSLLLGLSVLQIVDKDLAIKAAENYRTLRAKGITARKTVDTWIATFCIEHGHSLLFSDRDFGPFVKHLALKSALAT
jgi:predicted nucleic acid-binding protein